MSDKIVLSSEQWIGCNNLVLEVLYGAVRFFMVFCFPTCCTGFLLVCFSTSVLLFGLCVWL